MATKYLTELAARRASLQGIKLYDPDGDLWFYSEEDGWGYEDSSTGNTYTEDSLGTHALLVTATLRCGVWDCAETALTGL